MNGVICVLSYVYTDGAEHRHMASEVFIDKGDFNSAKEAIDRMHRMKYATGGWVKESVLTVIPQEMIEEVTKNSD